MKRLCAALMLALLLQGCGGGPTRTTNASPSTSGASLTGADVGTIVTAAASAASVPYVVAVVDRGGTVLAVYRKLNAPATATGNFGASVSTDDLAVGLARTAAFFSNNQAPLSSRTVRFISGIHFPPGVANTPNAALYGIENTNRGCRFGDLPAAIAPRFPVLTSTMPGAGIITGKVDTLDSDATAVNPGGVPLFKDGQVVGGIGIAGAPAEVAEFAAVSGSLGANFGPSLPLPPPGAVLIDGIALPFVLQTSRPAGLSAGAADGTFSVGPQASAGPLPDGDLIAPKAGAIGGLSAQEVRQIVDASIATANITRAAIRLPAGQSTRMVIAVADLDGTILALNRMPDATVFSLDVAISKARNMNYFNSQRVSPADLPGVPASTAVTNRTISFGAQPFFPPGIDGSQPGPFFSLYTQDVAHPCSQGADPANPRQSGIVFFPGSAGLYRNGVLVGALGISGDGVEQDDFVTNGGVAGFDAPTDRRADQVIVREVRLPYLKFPRNPTLP